MAPGSFFSDGVSAGRFSCMRVLENGVSSFDCSAKPCRLQLFKIEICIYFAYISTFDVVLKKELEHSKRKSTVLCLLMIDIDDFKQVNDTHGHLVGDEVLNGIGATLNDTIREMDLAARYGGEELAVIMPGVSLSQGYQVAERIRKRIQGISFGEAKVTISVGVSQSERRGDSPERLINSADKALYAAKAEGKNRVVKAERGT